MKKLLMILASLTILLIISGGINKTTMSNNSKLTPEEIRVIVNKGTEMPGTGKYLHNKQQGIYTCKRCGAELYRSEDKFESHCGWPAFDDEIKGAVKRIPDPDGHRTEIICASCGAHLGHVFTGEHFTDKNVRHCVNSISMNFIKTPNNKVKKAVFAGGCFWGVEYFMEKENGVIDVKSGYIGGNKENPTYQEVCSHTTGHVEAVEVTFDPQKTSYEKLLKVFFEIHDFTQTNGQGPDIGSQYLSRLFPNSKEQIQVAKKIIAELKAKGFNVATKIEKASKFWPAEEYHQNYYVKKGGNPYCHKRQKIF